MYTNKSKFTGIILYTVCVVFYVQLYANSYELNNDEMKNNMFYLVKLY